MRTKESDVRKGGTSDPGVSGKKGENERGTSGPSGISPGSAIVSVKSANKDGNYDLNDYYSVKSGTSMATPISLTPSMNQAATAEPTS